MVQPSRVGDGENVYRVDGNSDQAAQETPFNYLPLGSVHLRVDGYSLIIASCFLVAVAELLCCSSACRTGGEDTSSHVGAASLVTLQLVRRQLEEREGEVAAEVEVGDALDRRQLPARPHFAEGLPATLVFPPTSLSQPCLDLLGTTASHSYLLTSTNVALFLGINGIAAEQTAARPSVSVVQFQ